MYSAYKHSCRVCFYVLMMALAHVTKSAGAPIVLYHFAGEITDSTSALVPAGQRFEGQFGYDLAAPDFFDDDSEFALYEYEVLSPTVMTFTAGGLSHMTSLSLSMSVFNNDSSSGGDVFFVDSDTTGSPTGIPTGRSSAVISLEDPSEMVFNSDAAPATLELADFSVRLFAGNDGRGGLFEGTIDTLDAVPEPASLLSAVLLIALLALGRRGIVKGRFSVMFLALISALLPTPSHALQICMQPIADISPGPSSSNPHAFTKFGDHIIFMATDSQSSSDLSGIWYYSTDGFSVTPLQGRETLGHSGAPHDIFVEFQEELYFHRGSQLYKTDGQTVVRLTEEPLASSIPRSLRPSHEGLYFIAAGTSGPEYYRTDGTSVKPLGVGAITFELINGSRIPVPAWEHSTEFNGDLYFLGDGENGIELYRTNATETVAFDINPGPAGAFKNVGPGFAELAGNLFFVAEGTNGVELFKTDGTSITEINLRPGLANSSPTLYTEFNGELYFSASSEPFRRQLFRTNGTQITPVADLGATSSNSFPDAEHVQVIGDKFYFQTPDGLFVTDGSEITQVADIAAGQFQFEPGGLWEINDQLLFTTEFGIGLFKFDGTTVTQLSDLPLYLGMAELGGELLFRTSEGVFATDGFSFTPVPLLDSSIVSGGFHRINDVYVFRGGNETIGAEPFRLEIVPEPRTPSLILAAAVFGCLSRRSSKMSQRTGMTRSTPHPI